MSAPGADMLRECVEITNQRGLHARASAKFVNMVAMLPDSLRVTVSKDGAEAVGGSILGLMMLGAAKGDTIEIAVAGEGAEAALAKLVGLVKDRFGED
jgi:phosphocarrier protein